MVTLANHDEKLMVKSVADDGRTVELMTLTGNPCVLSDVLISDLEIATAGDE